MLVEYDQPNPFGTLCTKVTINSDTTAAELEKAYPMLKVKSDNEGQYIHTTYCRFTPGTVFFINSKGIPTYFLSAKALS